MMSKRTRALLTRTAIDAMLQMNRAAIMVFAPGNVRWPKERDDRHVEGRRKMARAAISRHQQPAAPHAGFRQADAHRLVGQRHHALVGRCLDNLAGNVKVETHKSDIIRATQLKGSLELRGKGADLELDSIQGPVTVSGAYSGTIQLRNLAKAVRLECQQMEFSAAQIPGEIRSSLKELVGSNIVGPIRMTASRGRDVNLTDFTLGLEVDVARGDITLKPSSLPVGKMNVKTRNGDIDLTLPEQAKFELNGSTKHGEASNEWGDALKQESDKHGSTLVGTVGVQGPTLSLTTERGGFTIHKANGEVAVPHKAVRSLKSAPEVRVE